MSARARVAFVQDLRNSVALEPGGFPRVVFWITGRKNQRTSRRKSDNFRIQPAKVFNDANGIAVCANDAPPQKPAKLSNQIASAAKSGTGRIISRLVTSPETIRPAIFSLPHSPPPRRYLLLLRR